MDWTIWNREHNKPISFWSPGFATARSHCHTCPIEQLCLTLNIGKRLTLAGVVQFYMLSILRGVWSWAEGDRTVVANRSLCTWGQPRLHSKSQDRQGYKIRPCLKTNKQTFYLKNSGNTYITKLSCLSQGGAAPWLHPALQLNHWGKEQSFNAQLLLLRARKMAQWALLRTQVRFPAP